MPRHRRSELAAGLFVIGALAVATGVVLWLGLADVFRPTRQRAFFYVDERSGSVGLTVGNPVQITDTPIGKVVDIRYQPQHRRSLYEVQIEREGIAIRSDAAAVVTAGLVGEARLVITSVGSPDSPLADADHPAPIAGGLDGAMRDLALAVRDVREIAQAVRVALGGTADLETLQRILRIVTNIEDATGTAARIARNLLPETEPGNAESMLAGVRQSVADINTVTANIRRETQADQPDTILGKARTLMTKGASLAEKIDREVDAEAEGSAMAKVHAAVDSAQAIAADAKPKISALLTSARDAAERLDSFSRKDVAEVFAQLRQANTKVLAIANDLSDVSDAARKIVVLNRENIDRMIDNMAQVSESLKSTANEVRRSPWRLFRQPKPGEMRSYDVLTAAAAFSEGAASLDRAVTKLKSLHPDVVAPDDKQIQQIREHLDDTFRKFKKIEEALWKEISTDGE